MGSAKIRTIPAEVRDLVGAKLVAMTVPEPNTGCELWTEGVDSMGYGILYAGARTMGAHVAAWLYKHGGNLPREMKVCHRCDTRACCNVDHLFLGSQGENMRDCAAKGRSNKPRGENHPRARMTEASVRELRLLRARGWMQKDLMTRYGVSQTVVNHILTGRTWKCVE